MTKEERERLLKAARDCFKMCADVFYSVGDNEKFLEAVERRRACDAALAGDTTGDVFDWFGG